MINAEKKTEIKDNYYKYIYIYTIIIIIKKQ